MSSPSNNVPEPSVASSTPVDDEPKIDTPTQDIESGAAIIRKEGPKRTSIWDGMILMVTPAPPEDAKAKELSAQSRAVRKRLILLGFTALAIVAITLGLSFGLAQSKVETSSLTDGTNSRSTDESTTTSGSQAHDPPMNSIPSTTEALDSPRDNSSSSTSSPSAAAVLSSQTSTPEPTTTIATTTVTPAPTTTTPAPTPAPPQATKTMNFINKCPYPISLHRVDTLLNTLPTGAQHSDTIHNGEHTMYRHTRAAEATLVEVTMDGGKLWYDISIIPPGCGNGASWDACWINSGHRSGFNVPVSVVPSKYDGIPSAGNCHTVVCLEERCPAAYLYPSDDLKMKDCPDSERFIITFCP